MNSNSGEPEDRWFAGAWPGRWRMLDIGEDPRDYTPPDDIRLRRAIDAQLARHPLPSRVGQASLEPHFLCEDCNALILDDIGGDYPESAWIGDWTGSRWTWRPIPPVDWSAPPDPTEALGGDHRHDDLAQLADGIVRFYYMHPTGPYKSEAIGSWANVIDAMPYVIMPSQPFPPMTLLNEKLAEGMDHAGMSGGVEFPPTQLSPQQYREIRADPIWVARGIAPDAP